MRGSSNYKQKYIVDSNNLQLGEYLLDDEFNDFVFTNNLKLIYLDDRIIAPTNASCYCGQIGGEVFHTFIRVSNNIYQYLGIILKNAEVGIIDNLFPARLIAYVKKEIKQLTKNYIIEFGKKFIPDLSYRYDITVYTDNFERYNYSFTSKELSEFSNLYCNIFRRKKNDEKIMYLENLISELDERKYNNDNDHDYIKSRKFYETETIKLYLNYQKTILIDDEKKKFY